MTVGVLAMLMGLGSVAGAAVAPVKTVAALPTPLELGAGWRLQNAEAVSRDRAPLHGGAAASGAEVSSVGFKTEGWYPAVVPGTVLTSLVAAGVYPEPLYGENNRPDRIPESLARSAFWYRAEVTVPRSYLGRHVYLNFDGINYAAEVWVNGVELGGIKGAFLRGRFDITALARPGRTAVVAVLVTPQPHPGEPHEHTIANGMGLNGGITAIDGPTFLSTIGWDWIPAIRDRDAGIWQRVFLSASGPVEVRDPLVTTDLPLPRLDTADVSVKATVENVTKLPVTGVLRGSFEGVAFEQTVTVPARGSLGVAFDPATTPALHLANPKLWWPNGYGPQNLYDLHLSFSVRGRVSDAKEVSFGVRKIQYTVPDSENLTLSVNGVRVFIRGGDWGLDEAMKRIPRERLEAQIRMHQVAKMNLIRNWVGQSTSEDFYALCDKYGILLWDEFFQPNPSDGPNPTDLPTYIANVRDKILRFRNHPSIAVWCARNEGPPPPEIDAALRTLLAELEPTRLYQPSSTDGHGVNSGGPYHWRTPREFYKFNEAFKTETGSVSVPTLESVQGMMPQQDWETINDDWAEHDFAKGASDGNTYRDVIEARYGKLANLADFVRKAQLANYEAFRAMYEGRNAKLFAPSTGVITWMSNPAQPSFVWQLYHHDLEANASLYAVQKAAEMSHIQLNEATGEVQVINNQPVALTGKAKVSVYGIDGSVAYEHEYPVSAPPSLATALGLLEVPAGISAVHFVKLELKDAAGTLLSHNFYWQGTAAQPDDLTALNDLKPIQLDMTANRTDAAGKTTVAVTLRNPGTQVALMAHVQLRRASGERVLPAYYTDNYISLVPGETTTLRIEANPADLKGEAPLLTVDGWNVGVASSTASGVPVQTNINAQVDHWPVTGIPMMVPEVK